MYEEDLKRLVCLHPELIEPGFVVLEEESPISTGQTCYNCDLRGKDKADRNVYVELKLKAGRDVVYQIAKYKTFARDQARYIVAALDFHPEAKKVLETMDFETVEIDSKRAAELLEQARANPALYQRKSTLTQKALGLKVGTGGPLYSVDQTKIVTSFMRAMEVGLGANLKLLPGYNMEGIDVKLSDKYRLFFFPESFPRDRLLIYNRARKAEEIHFIYVPDFSFRTGNSTERKLRFRKFLLSKSDELEESFNLPLFSSRCIRKMTEDHLEVTSQAWKGFSRVYYRPLDCWQHPDFIEMMVREFIDFAEKLAPLLDECFGMQQTGATLASRRTPRLI